MATKAKEIDLNMISEDDMVIALMGPTGTGKTTFIDTATSQKGKTAKRAPKPVTSDIRAVRYLHPTTLKPIVLVDTPGFDDPTKSDTDIFIMIADWLEKTYKKKIQLDGIIYLHRISDNRMGGVPLKNLQMFAKICGDDAIKNVVFTTTMWTNVKADLGGTREQELMGKYWAPMMNAGAQTMRFEDSFNSAWQIIDKIVGVQHTRRPLLLQEELVDLGRRPNETEAGKTLYSTLQQLRAEQSEIVRKLHDEAKAEQNKVLVKELMIQYGNMQEALQSTGYQLKNMRISLGRRILMLFTFRGPHASSLHVSV